jgi:hypothetical protein
MLHLLTLLTAVTVASADVHVESVRTWNSKPYHNKGLSKGFPYEKEISNEMFNVIPGNIMTLEQKRQESLRTKAAVDDGTYEILTVSPTAIDNNDVITVSFFSTNPTPHTSSGYDGDWIGAYSPSDVDITTTVPVKYGWCDEDLDYMKNGNGQLTFNMTNLRADIKFYYFTGGTATPVNVNSSDTTVVFNDINEPLRPRVVPTGDPDTFNLLWSSATSTAPTLRWGTSTGSYPNIVSAVTTELLKEQMSGPPANSTGWREQGLIHTAPLAGMEALANSRIYYIFGDNATDFFSGEYVFQVPPLAGTNPPNRSTTAVLYCDMGRGSTDDTYTWNEYGRPAVAVMEAVGDEVLRGEVDVVFHGGDISYATGMMAVWDFFMNSLSPVASGALYLTTVGNHESDCPNSPSYYVGSMNRGWGDSGGECGWATTTMLPMPAPAVNDKPWWSYDVGLIHFVGMSTEHDYTVGSEQYLWLEADLAAVDRTVTPWIIFNGHRAMYLNSNYGGSKTSDITVMNMLIDNIEPLLWKYRVNLAFWGHNHVVQRQSAVLNKTVVQRSTQVYETPYEIATNVHTDPQATVHMVIGTAGAGFTVNYVEPYPDWNEMVFYRWGYARVQAVDANTLEWEWIDGFDNEAYDKMRITQNVTESWVLPEDTTTTSDEGGDDDDGLSTGSLIGIYLASALVIAVVSIGVYVLVTRQISRESADDKLLNNGM